MNRFEWDEEKNVENQLKHGIDFFDAQQAFLDFHRLIIRDVVHSTPQEDQLFCVGRIEGGVATVRFTYREQTIRIFGAGYWRKYRKQYFAQF